jgi:hypothetical protein
MWIGVGSVPFIGQSILEFTKGQNIKEWWADPHIFKDGGDAGDSTGQILNKMGIPFQAAKNDREEGWAVCKSWLFHDDNPPMFQSFYKCKYFNQTIPILQYATSIKQKKEDLNTRMEDDAADAWRYVMLNGYNYPAKQPDYIKETKMYIPKLNAHNRLAYLQSDFDYQLSSHYQYYGRRYGH